MTDREERQHVIEVLKQMRLDYEDFWEENDTEEIKAFNYAIASIETDLRYDLLYEETSGQADNPTTKNDLGVDAISRKAVQTRLKEIINEMETIFADIREREVDDSVCGLCEYDCDHGLDGFANECPGFEKDDCFKLKEKYRAEWLDIKNLPPASPQEPRKGEWLRMSDLSEQEDDRYKCSHCGNVIHHKNKMDLYTFNSWCGRCGSDNGRHINYIDNMKYKVCCPMCDNKKCVKGTGACEAEKWAKSKAESEE